MKYVFWCGWINWGTFEGDTLEKAQENYAKTYGFESWAHSCEEELKYGNVIGFELIK